MRFGKLVERNGLRYRSTVPLSPEQEQLYLSYLELLHNNRSITNVTSYESGAHSSGFIPGHVDRQSGWTCSYCGGMRPSEAHRCEGCGAARTAIGAGRYR